MIKNIAAAAALAFGTALLACAPAQAAAAPTSFPLPPFGYTLVATPFWHAPLLDHPAHAVYYYGLR
ncbi:hypothetical protein ACGFYU_14895 [Streptomyces sp. NPDC048337]|uniref:hypothetical protein n=1 Tax=Streptomyces sp. NPDC048337 TaxID=3365535 RepID=UPI003712800E